MTVYDFKLVSYDTLQRGLYVSVLTIILPRLKALRNRFCNFENAEILR